jgi:hypothetical protein
MHIEDVLGKKQKMKRTLQGIGAFLKTRESVCMWFSRIVDLTPSQLLVYVWP